MKPSYEELANAFAEYLAFTSNDGGIPYSLNIGDGNLTVEDVLVWEASIDRASAVVEAAGGVYRP